MRASLFLVCAATVAACGGSQASFSGGVYRRGEVAFRVGPLSGWERVRVRGNDLAFYRESEGAIIAVNGECDAEKDPPLRTLAMQTLIGFTDRDFRLEEFVSIDRREAMHMVVHAKLDGVPRVISLYVLKKDECLYDFTYVAGLPREGGDATATANADADAIREFDQFVLGFQALPGEEP